MNTDGPVCTDMQTSPWAAQLRHSFHLCFHFLSMSIDLVGTQKVWALLRVQVSVTGVLGGPEKGRNEGRAGSHVSESTLCIWGRVQAAVLDGSLSPICHLPRFIPKLFSFSLVIMCLLAMEPAAASWKKMHCRLLHSCFPQSFQDRCSSREMLQLAPLFFNPL